MKNNLMKKSSEGKKDKRISQGWECPKCGSVYAIWVSECSRCVNSNIRYIVKTSGTYEK